VINYIDLLKQPVAFHRIYATLGGGAAAGVFISQLMYWHEKMKKHHGKSWDGWFYKNGIEWEEETGTTRHEREKTEKLLKGLKIIQIKKKGIPPTKNYRVNERLFNQAIDDLLNGKTPSKPSKDNELQDSAKHNAKSGNTNGEIQQNISPDVAVQTAKSGDINCQISPYNTEITTETTQENTTQTLCASEKTEDAGEGDFCEKAEEKTVWISENKKELKGKQLEIFQQLWEAFKNKQSRARAIDEYLKNIVPLFGKDAEANRNILKALLESIKRHVTLRNLSDSTSKPQHFENWISGRRWEDDFSESKYFKEKTAAINTPQESNQLWSVEGFDSFEDHQNYISTIAQLKLLKELKNPTQLQLDMITTTEKALDKMNPKKLQGEAA